MLAYKEEKIKITAVAVIAILAFSCGLVLFSTDMSSAEDDEAEVSEETITIDGEKYDVYLYLGAYYIETDDTQSEEQAAIIGIDVDYAKSHEDKVFAVCSFTFVDSDEEETTYTVTSVHEKFAQYCKEASYTAFDFFLSEEIIELPAGCFDSLTFGNTLVANDDVDNKSGLTVTPMSDAGSYDITVGIGDVKKTVKENYNEDYKDDDYTYTVTFTKGIVFTAPECEFENPYYDFTEWARDGYESISDGANLLVIDLNRFYIDTEWVEDGFASYYDAQWEENKDYLADGAYEEWMMWATVAIIVILAIVGLAMFSYRTVMARRG